MGYRDQDAGARTCKFTPEEMKQIKAGQVPVRIAKQLMHSHQQSKRSLEEGCFSKEFLATVQFPFTLLEQGIAMTREENQAYVQELAKKAKELLKRAEHEPVLDRAHDYRARALMAIVIGRLLQSIEFFN